MGGVGHPRRMSCPSRRYGGRKQTHGPSREKERGRPRGLLPIPTLDISWGEWSYPSHIPTPVMRYAPRECAPKMDK